MPAPLFMETISLKRGKSLKSMASLKKGKQHFKRSLCKLQSSENSFTNVLKPKGYHPITYLDWMALGFQSSAADRSCLNGRVVACAWNTLSSSLSRLSAPQFTTTLKQHINEQDKILFLKIQACYTRFDYEAGLWQYYTEARDYAWRQKAKGKVLVTSAKINHWIKITKSMLCSTPSLNSSPHQHCSK